MLLMRFHHRRYFHLRRGASRPSAIDIAAALNALLRRRAMPATAHSFDVARYAAALYAFITVGRAFLILRADVLPGTRLVADASHRHIIHEPQSAFSSGTRRYTANFSLLYRI